MKNSHIRFGEFMVEQGVVREADIRQALYVCGRRGNRIGDGLVESGVLKRPQVEELHARFLRAKKAGSDSEGDPHFFLRSS